MNKSELCVILRESNTLFPTGKYVHIKFIDYYDQGGSNMDVEYLALVGVLGSNDHKTLKT